MRQRQVVCAGLETGVFKEFPDSSCDKSYKPESTSSCFQRPCSKWFTTSWSQVNYSPHILYKLCLMLSSFSRMNKTLENPDLKDCCIANGFRVFVKTQSRWCFYTESLVFVKEQLLLSLICLLDPCVCSHTHIRLYVNIRIISKDLWSRASMKAPVIGKMADVKMNLKPLKQAEYVSNGL